MTSDEGKSAIWNLGIRMLVDSGLSEVQARVFIGGLIKRCNGQEEVVGAAIGMAAFKAPVEPRSYLIGLIERRVNGKPTATERNFETRVRVEQRLRRRV